MARIKESRHYEIILLPLDERESYYKVEEKYVIVSRYLKIFAADSAKGTALTLDCMENRHHRDTFINYIHNVESLWIYEHETDKTHVEKGFRSLNRLTVPLLDAIRAGNIVGQYAIDTIDRIFWSEVIEPACKDEQCVAADFMRRNFPEVIEEYKRLFFKPKSE